MVERVSGRHDIAVAYLCAGVCPCTKRRDDMYYGLIVTDILTLRKLTLNLCSQLNNFLWLRLTTSIKRRCYVILIIMIIAHNTPISTPP